MNDVIDSLQETSRVPVLLPVLSSTSPVCVQGICDASLQGRQDLSSQGARATGLRNLDADNFAPCDVRSTKIRRKASSSFDAETLQLVEQTDICLLVKLLVEELEFGKLPSLVERQLLQLDGFAVNTTGLQSFIDTDCNDAITRIYSLKSSLDVSKRRRGDIADLQECVELGDISQYRHICGTSNPMDILTKKYGKGGLSKQKQTYVRFLQLVYEGKYIADLTNNNITNSRNCQCFYCQL